MIIFFEGLPGSGKTEVTQYLEKKYPFCVRLGETVDEELVEIKNKDFKDKGRDFFNRSEILKIKKSKINFPNKIIFNIKPTTATPVIK